jgi:hypothetical protein
LVRGIWTSNDGNFVGEAGAGGRASDLAADGAESLEAKVSEGLWRRWLPHHSLQV